MDFTLPLHFFSSLGVTEKVVTYNYDLSLPVVFLACTFKTMIPLLKHAFTAHFWIIQESHCTLRIMWSIYRAGPSANSCC